MLLVAPPPHYTALFFSRVGGGGGSVPPPDPSPRIRRIQPPPASGAEVPSIGWTRAFAGDRPISGHSFTEEMSGEVRVVVIE